MATQITYPHIEKPKNGSARLESMPKIRVARIVMDYLAHGWSPSEMCRQHSHLTLAQVHSAMAYYFDHQDEIDREIAAECSDVETGREQAANTPIRAKLRAKGLL